MTANLGRDALIRWGVEMGAKYAVEQHLPTVLVHIACWMPVDVGPNGVLDCRFCFTYPETEHCVDAPAALPLSAKPTTEVLCVLTAPNSCGGCGPTPSADRCARCARLDVISDRRDEEAMWS